MQNRVDITGNTAIVVSIATDDKRTRCSTRHLYRCGAMPVRVVPERACGMIRWNVEFILEARVRRNIEQHIVAVPCRRDM